MLKADADAKLGASFGRGETSMGTMKNTGTHELRLFSGAKEGHLFLLGAVLTSVSCESFVPPCLAYLYWHCDRTHAVHSVQLLAGSVLETWSGLLDQG